MTLYPDFRCTFTVRIFLDMYWLVPVSALAQIRGKLRPGIGGDVDAAAERTAHIGGDLFDSVQFQRVRDEDAGLSVRVIDCQLYRDDAAVMLQRTDSDFEPFPLYLAVPTLPHYGE